MFKLQIISYGVDEIILLQRAVCSCCKRMIRKGGLLWTRLQLLHY